ncbi:MAG TPA: tryptophan/tyrosine permease [Lentisphaeria bacterium]|nr:MAG: hypothetical protein A2X47_02300 [Lentisphaerae bacterium GWF2_38_69]HBM16730.1 tryptophan/tyrosine permease [Lentisphaeria bacterium]
MHVSFRFIGGILIIIGTCIGGGILALPVGTSPDGFVTSVIVLFFVWFFMVLGALLFLEMTQWFPTGSNIISISHGTLGRFGEIVAWIIYIFLCYSLISAYVAGGGDIIKLFSGKMGFNLAGSISAIIFVLILGSVVYKGVKSIDIINRWLMTLKFIALFAIIYMISPHVEMKNLLSGSPKYVTSAISITITSFGFSLVVPSLYDYFKGNVRIVRRIIYIGSLIPLCCYILWMFVIMGSIPAEGDYGLISILKSGEATSGLIQSIQKYLNINSITSISSFFVSICVLTSFLGVSLALSDFFVDALKLPKTRPGRFKKCLFTFVPPLLIVIFFPRIFVIALSYAGLFVIIQQIILPSIIIWKGRYILKIAKGYEVPGGKTGLCLMLIIGIIVFIICALGCLKFISITTV